MDFIIKNGNFTIEYIKDATQLAECVQYLSKVPVFAFDLEFDKNRYKYGFNLCLIQIATSQRCFVIDPLENIKLQELFKLFENPNITKLVHSCGEDMRLLQHLKCYPKNVFDTEIGAKLLNYEHTSLAKLLESKLEITLDKTQQASNWTLRPLSVQQIKYSSNDVIYLLTLKEFFDKELKEKGLFEFFEQENTYLSNVKFEQETNANLVIDYLSKDDKRTLSEYQQYILQEMLAFREIIAKKTQKPTTQVVANQTMREIALGTVQISNWLTMSGIYWKIKTEEYQQKFNEKYTQVLEDAGKKSLSKDVEAQIHFSDEQYELFKAQRKLQDAIFDKTFQPIQVQIAKKYGVFAGRFMFSTNLVMEIIKKHKKITELPFPYRIEIILQTANDLNIDLEEYKYNTMDSF